MGRSSEFDVGWTSAFLFAEVVSNVAKDEIWQHQMISWMAFEETVTDIHWHIQWPYGTMRDDQDNVETMITRSILLEGLELSTIWSPTYGIYWLICFTKQLTIMKAE